MDILVKPAAASRSDELSSIYIAVAEEIGNLPRRERQQANIIYNAACYALDYHIRAWYKSPNGIDRCVDDSSDTSGGGGEGGVKSRCGGDPLTRLFQVPWLLPILSREDGIDVTFKRELQAHILPNYILLDEGRLVRRHGNPSSTLKCVGFGFCAVNLATDQELLDMTKDAHLREIYSDAQVAFLEMGAKHTRNIPRAGIVFPSPHELTLTSRDRMASVWKSTIQGGLFRPSAIYRWIQRYDTHHLFKALEDIHFSTDDILPIVTWKSIEEAKQWIDVLYYQISSLVSYSYLLDKPGGTIRSMPPITPCPPPINKPFPLNLITVHHPSRCRGEGVTLLAYTYIYPFLKTIIKNKGPIERMKLFLSSSDVRSQVIKAVRRSQPSQYDPKRARYLQRLAHRIRSMSSLSERERSLVSLRKELVFKNHRYIDKVTSSPMFCEHELDALKRISIGEDDPQPILDKYALDPNHTVFTIFSPTIIECKYCGMDLGSNWLVGKESESTYQSAELNIIFDRLLSSKSIVIQHTTPSHLYQIVERIIKPPLAFEAKRMTSSSDRVEKMTFYHLAAIVASINTLSSAGAPVRVDKNALEAHLSKEYVAVLQRLGLVATNAIERILSYWDKVMVKQLSSPASLIENSVLDIIGTREDNVLLDFYTTALKSPLRSKEPWDKMKPTKPSLKRYLNSILSTELPPHGRRKPHAYTKRNPHIRVDKMIQPSRHTYAFTRPSSMGSEGVALAVKFICPELLIHPKKGDTIGPPISFGPHDFVASSGNRSSIEGKTCSRCHIPSDYSVTPAYLSKYKKVVETEWLLAKPAPMPSCRSPRQTKIIGGPVPTIEKMDMKLHQRFSHTHGWQGELRSNDLNELIYLVAGIGFYRLARDIQSGKINLLPTAWNRFMTWALGETKEVVSDILHRFR